MLTREERKKLYDLLYNCDEYGIESCISDAYYAATKEEVDELNQSVFENMDKETRAIVIKCGANPQSIFSFGGYMPKMDTQLSTAMKACGMAQVENIQF